MLYLVFTLVILIFEIFFGSNFGTPKKYVLRGKEFNQVSIFSYITAYKNMQVVAFLVCSTYMEIN